MSAVIFIIVMLVTFFGGHILFVDIILGDSSYDISSLFQRVLIAVLAFGPPTISILVLLRRFDNKKLSYKKAGKLGALAGLAFSAAWFVYSGIEYINGYLDSDAESISVRVQDVIESRRSRPYMLVVEDWRGTGERLQLFWGPDYPEGWDKSGNCLIARVGPGAFGLQWIEDQRIEPCRSE